jgi:hypothetical protein
MVREIAFKRTLAMPTDSRRSSSLKESNKTGRQRPKFKNKKNDLGFFFYANAHPKAGVSREQDDEKRKRSAASHSENAKAP